MEIIFFVMLFIVGACIGSFLCCQARRMYLKTTDKKEKFGSRSICLSCHKRLKWYDNIPIFSWLFLRGKCRYCHKKIGIIELLSEFFIGLAFLLIGMTVDIFSAIPLEWFIFGTTLILFIVLGFLAIYDGMCGELPLTFLILAICIAFVIAILKVFLNLEVEILSAWLILRPIVSVAIIGGLYLILYLVSKGKWVGDGDWLLGTAIGLALFEPWLSLVTLFVANVTACLVMLPCIKKGKKHQKVFFGPFMVFAFVVVLFLSDFLFYAIG